MAVFTLPAVVKGVTVAYAGYFALKTVYGIFVDPELGHHPLLERAGLVVSGVLRRSNPGTLVLTIGEQTIGGLIDLVEASEGGSGTRLHSRTPPMWMRDP